MNADTLKLHRICGNGARTAETAPTCLRHEAQAHSRTPIVAQPRRTSREAGETARSSSSRWHWGGALARMRRTQALAHRQHQLGCIHVRLHLTAELLWGWQLARVCVQGRRYTTNGIGCSHIRCSHRPRPVPLVPPAPAARPKRCHLRYWVCSGVPCVCSELCSECCSAVRILVHRPRPPLVEHLRRLLLVLESVLFIGTRLSNLYTAVEVTH